MVPHAVHGEAARPEVPVVAVEAVALAALVVPALPQNAVPVRAVPHAVHGVPARPEVPVVAVEAVALAALVEPAPVQIRGSGVEVVARTVNIVPTPHRNTVGAKPMPHAIDVSPGVGHHRGTFIPVPHAVFEHPLPLTEPIRLGDTLRIGLTHRLEPRVLSELLRIAITRDECMLHDDRRHSHLTRIANRRIVVCDTAVGIELVVGVSHLHASVVQAQLREFFQNALGKLLPFHMRLIIPAARIRVPHLGTIGATRAGRIDMDAHKCIGTNGNRVVHTLLEPHIEIGRARHVHLHIGILLKSFLAVPGNA